MPTINLPEADLFYALARGDKTGRRHLILVHGAGGSHLDWPAELRRLPETNVYALDLPGHGRSGGQGRISVEAYADAVAAFVEGLGLDRVAVAGHSMGGAIGQTLALRRPPWLSHLILIGSGARLRVAPAILDGLLDDPEKTIEQIVTWTYGPHAPPEIPAAGRRRMLSVSPQTTRGDYQACDAFDVMEQVEQIAVPTLVIAGTEDKLTPLKYGAYLAGRIPSAQLVTIEGGGHMVMLEFPADVAQAIAGFLRA